MISSPRPKRTITDEMRKSGSADPLKQLESGLKDLNDALLLEQQRQNTVLQRKMGSGRALGLQEDAVDETLIAAKPGVTAAASAGGSAMEDLASENAELKKEVARLKAEEK